MEIETKICTKCGDPKLLKDFPKNKTKKGGFDNWCKICVKRYKKENSNIIAKCTKKYKGIHKKETKKYNAEYYQSNKIRLNKYRNGLRNNQRNNDPVCRLNHNIGAAIRRSLKGDKNGHSWNRLVGYDTQELKRHLEIRFKDGMSWDNYGYGEDKWHIDHKIPVSLFNITSKNSKGFKTCWALENLRPMWQIENMRKSNKLFM